MAVAQKSFGSEANAARVGLVQGADLEGGEDRRFRHHSCWLTEKLSNGSNVKFVAKMAPVPAGTPGRPP